MDTCTHVMTLKSQGRDPSNSAETYRVPQDHLIEHARAIKAEIPEGYRQPIFCLCYCQVLHGQGLATVFALSSALVSMLHSANAGTAVK
jgi:hypothetical protein